MSESADGPQLYKKDFWSKENLKYDRPHFRMEKSARVINKIAGDGQYDLLDVGCGPATLERLLRQNVHYHGIDIAIQEPASNLIEMDFLESPIEFRGMKFDIVLAQGVFEYVGDQQLQKFAEIRELLNENGIFLVSYVNFGHRGRKVYWPYSNVQLRGEFQASLESHFDVGRIFPTSYNWRHNEPNRRLAKAAQMNINANIPVIGPMLAVEYFFVCSPRTSVG
jgi:SAM-dependent methyltransferase